MSALRRASPMRPTEPPPYPGRSIIRNYNIDDPHHWKNRQEKRQPQVTTPAVHHHQREEVSHPDNTAIMTGRPSVSPNELRAVPSTAAAASPAPRPSPVAAGAILTLGELKRKQMHKRRCKLAASGVVNYEGSLDSVTPTEQGGDGEEDLDGAEMSLEYTLRRLIAKENLTLDCFPAMDYRLAPTTSFDRPDPETILQPLISPVPNSPSENDGIRPPRHMAPTVPNCLQAPTKPPRTVKSDSKFHVYGISSRTTNAPAATPGRQSPHVSSYSVPTGSYVHDTASQDKDVFSTRNHSKYPKSDQQAATRPESRRFQADSTVRPRSSSTGSRLITPLPNPPRKSVLFNIDYTQPDPVHPPSPTSPVSSQAANFIRPHPHRNYPVTTPPLPPVSPENDWSAGEAEAGPPAQETCFWADQRANLGREAAITGQDGDLDSTAGEARATSSDEGFCGNSDASSEDMARKQVLMMCDMQKELLKVLGCVNGPSGRHDKKEKFPMPLSRRDARPRQPTTYSDRIDSLGESETQLRCEILEDHIANLARNIEYLTDEIQNQQATLRDLQRLPLTPAKVRFARDYEHYDYEERAVPRARLNSCSDTMTPRGSLSSYIPEVPVAESVEKTETMFSNPERVSKLTKFFGSEPPLVRLFLKKLGYEKYARLFELEKIGLNELPYMSDDRLRKLGIPMGPRTRILREAQSVAKFQSDGGLHLV